MPWGNVTLTDFWDVWDPPDTGGASSSTDAWERSLPEPGTQYELRWPSDNPLETEEHPSGQVPSEEPADDLCACGRPCLFFTRPAGCKNGDSCRFCHAPHPAKVPHDRPSLRTRKQLKRVMWDFKDKGADLRLLSALARIRPYAQRLLAQEVVPLAPGEVTEPTPADGEHRHGLFHGTTVDTSAVIAQVMTWVSSQTYYSPAELEQWLSTPRATEDDLRDDSSVADSEMERFFDSLAS